MADPAHEIITAAMAALRTCFDPSSSHPPEGGGSNTVRFLAGDGSPDAAVMKHFHIGDDQQMRCAEPFLWVRLLRRYRTKQFPVVFLGDNPCQVPRAIAFELGVARCTETGGEDPGWPDYAREAEFSIDDSFRIEVAACRAEAAIRKGADGVEPYGTAVAADSVLPFGPEANILGWLTTMYVQI